MTLFFDYQLPERLIAQRPAARRDESRLLVVRRASGELEHRVFRELPELLASGDLLVLNDTKVLPARVVGRREKTGGKWEGLFLREAAGGLWEMLAQTRGYPQPGEGFAIDSPPVAHAPGSPAPRFVLRGRTKERHWLMEPDPPGSPAELLARFGHIPLPPYIRKGRAADEDRERYQTVFAERAGSVAAPTAGLHFTPDLFERLAGKGISTARVTLHVGLGTFAPVKADDPAKHVIHHEWCEVGQPAVDAIRACQARGGKVVAVGTTATRTVETAARHSSPSPLAGEGSERSERVRGSSNRVPSPPAPLPGGGGVEFLLSGGRQSPESSGHSGDLRPPLRGNTDHFDIAPQGERGEIGAFSGETGLYIHPPFEFRVVDALITNFHLPRTTLLLLVGAFAGNDLLRRAYEEAVRREYRFYSYGDAMLVL